MRDAGRQAALQAYGLKTAAVTPGQIASGARDLFIGAPGTWKELRRQAIQGKLTEPGGFYHRPFDWLIPQNRFAPKHAPFKDKALGVLETLGSYAQPLGMAYSGYQALSTPPEYRGQSVGALVGNLAGGALGAPFGMVGSTVGGMLGGLGGAQVGKLFDRSPEKDVQSQNSVSSLHSP